MKLRWLVIPLTVVTLAFIVAGAWLMPQHTFAGVVQAPPKDASDFSMSDETGRKFALSDLRGEWIMLAYGYTTCPDVCPATLAHLAEVKRQLGADAKHVKVVFVTVDPERDTSEVLARYVRKFDAEFKGLTGTPAEVAAAAQAYGARYLRVETQSAAGYLMSHSAFVYVIDPQFRHRLTFPFGLASQEMAADLKYLMTKKEN